MYLETKKSFSYNSTAVRTVVSLTTPRGYGLIRRGMPVLQCKRINTVLVKNTV